MGLLKEFRDFAMKGNIIDLATAVIIGGAFGKIVASLVDDIIMPPIGLLLGGVNFKELRVVLQPAKMVMENGVMKEAVKEVAIHYGNFIQNVFDFTIIAFCIFMVIKVYQRINRPPVEVVITEPAPIQATREEELLSEIRDLLRSQQGR